MARCEQCGAALHDPKHSERRFCDRHCAALAREATKPHVKVIRWWPCRCGCGRWFAPVLKGTRPHHGYIVGHNARLPRPPCRYCGAPVARLGGVYCTRACAAAARTNGSRRARTGARYRQWRRAVMKRDSGVCRDCGAPGLHVHHRESWQGRPDLRFDEANGVTLCARCHALRHDGRGFVSAWLTQDAPACPGSVV